MERLAIQGRERGLGLRAELARLGLEMRAIDGIAEQGILAMVLRKLSLQKPAHKHHRQLPLPRFEHIHQMHHVSPPVLASPCFC